MNRGTVLALPWIAAALAAALAAAWFVSQDREREPARGTLHVGDVLAGGGDAGFQRADAPREFRFPEDHGPHEGFRTEWWYFTGNLAAEDGRRFGYQLTFFRSALTADPAPRASAFAASHAWMAHFAISDLERQDFHDFERFAREGGGLAGARAESSAVHVWLRDWRCDFDASGTSVRLSARDGDFALELALDAGKAPVLNGDAGLSRKNAEAGNASYYYSVTRLAAAGRITLPGESFEVRGTAWLDREWSSGTLAREQVGWDWFALQLDDGTELMWYRLRREDGAQDRFDAGTFVAADGSARALGTDAVALETRGTWTSPRSGGEYPAGWRLTSPLVELDVRVTPAAPDQELDGSFRYWEGAVLVTGTRAGRQVAGRGYVELVGYAPGAAAGRAPRKP